jgi:hypothetical protein
MERLGKQGVWLFCDSSAESKQVRSMLIQAKIAFCETFICVDNTVLPAVYAPEGQYFGLDEIQQYINRTIGAT